MTDVRDHNTSPEKALKILINSNKDEFSCLLYIVDAACWLIVWLVKFTLCEYDVPGMWSVLVKTVIFSALSSVFYSKSTEYFYGAFIILRNWRKN